MPKILENIQFACATCRIVIYMLCRRLCCCLSLPLPPRPEINVICLGLANSGKSSILAHLSGEDASNVEPTIGFSIKAAQFKDCILNIKEVGGGDKVRPFWKHYYSGSQGIIFVIDSACLEEDLDDVKIELSNVLIEPQLAYIPCLILASCQDKDGARSAEQLKLFLELEKHCEGRKYLIESCTVTDKDIKTVKAAFEAYIKLLLDTPSIKGDTIEMSPAQKQAETRY